MTENLFREIRRFAVSIPALPRPSLETLREVDASIQSIERDVSPTGQTELVLGTVLRIGERGTYDAECKRRLGQMIGGCFGFQQGTWLVEHQDELPELMALPRKFWIKLLGLRVADAKGLHFSPVLCRKGGVRWQLGWEWVGIVLSRRSLIAKSRNS